MTQRLCVLDHPTPGHHDPDTCPGPTCTGCTPTRADEPHHTCRWHTHRHRRALADLPDLITHLHNSIEPSTSSGGEHVTRGEHAPPAPLCIDAIATADDLARVIRHWTARLEQERHLTPPTPTTTSARARQHAAVLHDVRRLLTHQDHTLTATWTRTYIEDITTEIHRARAAWPTEERPTWLPVPCPACGATSLARWAPRWAGAPTTIACDLDDCRTIVDEDRYPWLVRLAADLARTHR